MTIVRRVTRRVSGGALALLLSGVVVLATGGPAYAHNELRSTNPANGATVQTAPAEVSLTFAQTSNLQFVKIAVTDAAGASLVDGAPAENGTTLIQKVRPPAVAGKVVVSYRVVSNDGHPVQGSVTFTVPAAAVPVTPAATTPAASTSTASTSTATTPAPAPSTNAAAEESREGSSWLLPLMIGIIVVAAAATAFLTVRSRRRS